jgi:hypothetical protein
MNVQGYLNQYSHWLWAERPEFDFDRGTYVYLSLPHHAQTVSRAHSASCSMGFWGSVPEVKADEV